MVSQKRNIIFLFILFTSCIAFMASIPKANAAVIYSVNKQWVQLWINPDASVDIQYNITMTYLPGSSTPQGIVTVGLPRSGYQISYVKDLAGNSLSWSDSSSGGQYSIDVQLKTPIVLNNPNTFIVFAVYSGSSGMVYPDTTNQGNDALTFATDNFVGATGTSDVRVLIVLPDGITMNNVTAGLIKYPTNTPFNSVLMSGSNVAVYWNRTNWPATTQFNVGVSFPAKYVTLPGPNYLLYAILAIVIIAFIVLVVLVVRRVRKAVYEKPKISVEALGAARGLTAVEAAVVLGLKPVRVLTMILFSLTMKRLATVKDMGPPLKLDVTDTGKSDAAAPPIRYYEIDFLKAIQRDGLLDEQLLARTYLSLRDNVDRKLRGYSRVDTVNYYKSVVEEGWKQVTQAATPELKGDAIEKNIEWRLADEHYDDRFGKAFPPDLILLPRPGWYWYWWGPYRPGTGVPQGPAPSPAEVKPIPAQEWANNIVKGMQNMSNNIVKNVQDFSNKLVAAPPPQSSRPVHQASSCVCACAHCACACACVGCACACAGGGAR